MVVSDGVVKDVPVAIEVPPVEVVYQLIVPALAAAPSVTLSPTHPLAEVVPLIVGLE